MPTHSTVFSQPGPKLNPIGAKLTSPIHIEVFEFQRTIGSLPSGQWLVREASLQNIVKLAGRHSSQHAARYAAAALFNVQLEPWKIDGQVDPQARAFHFHLSDDQPSLCGSRFHQNFKDLDLTLHLPELRAVRHVLAPAHWKGLCQKCLELVDRTPAPGDRVRVRVSGRLGEIITVVDPDLKAGKVQRYVLKYDTAPIAADPGMWTASELALVMFESQPQT